VTLELGTLRLAIAHVMTRPAGAPATGWSLDAVLASVSSPAQGSPSSGGSSGRRDESDDAPSERLHALVDLARSGDAEAFGQLYDHYVDGVYRFIYYRVGSVHLAEDLTSETFVRGLRAVQRFTWQGKDFGAWLTTIARNLIADHYKSSRARLEIVADQVPEGRQVQDGPEDGVLRLLTNEILHDLVDALPGEQRDCILMRFIQGLSIAQTAAALGRSEGAVKQLQLRAVRNLAKKIPADLR
jgi:RNA polymerase sigma-70 factor (ECF subfamily)